MKKVILASTSPRRKELFEKTGIPFEIVASSYEEDMTLNMSPKDLAMYLSRGKAEDVANKYPNAVVIGADTFTALGNEVFGKPHTKEKAKERLLMLSGKQHSIITGFTIIEKSANKIISKAIETKVFFRDLTEQEIDDYIETGEPLDKAGAYAIQGLGGKLIEKTEGSYDNIIGLPVDEVVQILKDEFGVE